MLKNYLKIALRNITNSPLFATINIVGLAIGLACCIIITVFVQYETSYDRQWQDADRIHRVMRNFEGNDLRLAAIAPPIAPLLQQDFEEIEDIVRILRAGRITISRDELSLTEESVVIADPNLFEFFQLEFVSGTAAEALAVPSSVVLSERAAQRYFGNEDPLGQTVNVMGQMDATVTGVIRDLPDNTHMAMEVILSIEMMPMVMGPTALENWGSNNYYTYLRLPEGYDPDFLESQFHDFMVRHQGEDGAAGSTLEMIPLLDIHLQSNRDAEWRPNGSRATVLTFSAVAIGVLLIACINFMNLTTARSTQRAREVGVRKVVGAQREQLVFQFLLESTLLTSAAMLLALALVEVAMPAFAAFLEKPLVFSLADPATLVAVILFTLAVGLLAGSYPAFYLSHFRPVDVLKGAASGQGSVVLRRALVVFQFATSIALLIATGVVMAQMNYARNIDMGYDRERNIVSGLPFFAELWDIYTPMRTELESHPGIESVVYSSRVPSMQNLDGSGYFSEEVQLTMENVEALSDIKVDAHWFVHYDVEFLAGRSFRESELRFDGPTEENPVVNASIVLNESAARRFGWTPEQALGKILRQAQNRELTMFIDREVIGVIPDLHFSSLHDERKATAYAEPNGNYGRNISIKLTPGDPADAIAHLEAVWSRLVPDSSIDWSFLDDRFDQRYRSEQRQAQMFAVFSMFAVFVATLGLVGLATFTTERRTKEIGVRKVMGASVKDIVFLLTSDFTKLVLAANLIAWPVAYWLMNGWLSSFAYQVPFLKWAWLFVAAAVAALLVAWLTIASQASRAAMSRPVLALRYE